MDNKNAKLFYMFLHIIDFYYMKVFPRTEKRRHLPTFFHENLYIKLIQFF